MREAFLRLDGDLSSCGLQTLEHTEELVENVNLENLSACLSGAVVCAAYVNDCDLYIASTGDCTGMVANVDDEGQWSTETLSVHHTHKNVAEVKKIYADHPGEEANVIVAERLLGQLYPLRAFGDCQYKWPTDELKGILKHHQLMHLFPPGYLTPPYLTAEPEVRIKVFVRVK